MSFSVMKHTIFILQMEDTQLPTAMRFVFHKTEHYWIQVF